jgi:hypothetical protein
LEKVKDKDKYTSDFRNFKKVFSNESINKSKTPPIRKSSSCSPPFIFQLISSIDKGQYEQMPHLPLSHRIQQTLRKERVYLSLFLLLEQQQHLSYLYLVLERKHWKLQKYI